MKPSRRLLALAATRGIVSVLGLIGLASLKREPLLSEPVAERIGTSVDQIKDVAVESGNNVARALGAQEGRLRTVVQELRGWLNWVRDHPVDIGIDWSAAVRQFNVQLQQQIPELIANVEALLTERSRLDEQSAKQAATLAHAIETLRADIRTLSDAKSATNPEGSTVALLVALTATVVTIRKEGRADRLDDAELRKLRLENQRLDHENRTVRGTESSAGSDEPSALRLENNRLKLELARATQSPQ